MKKSYFERDMKNEQIITKWIERNFLMTVTDKYEIIQDSKVQNSGVDFIITSEKLFGYNLPYKVEYLLLVNSNVLDNRTISAEFKGNLKL